MAPNTVDGKQMLMVVQVEQGGALAEMSPTDAALLARNRAEIGSSFDYRPPRLTINPKSLKYENPATGEAYPDMDVVILAAKRSRNLWVEGQKRPLCSLVEANTGQYTSEGQVYSRPCATCPYNQWGSDPAGGPGKACKETRHLLALFPQALLPVIVSLPPSSCIPFDDYASALASRSSYAAVVTRMGLNTVENTRIKQRYGVATFRVVRPLVDPEKGAVLQMQDRFASFLATVNEDQEQGNGDLPAATEWEPPEDDPLFS